MEAYIAEIDAALRRLRRKKWLLHYWSPVLLAGLTCFLLLRFVVGIELVSGASMNPGLYSGDLIVFLRVGPPPTVGDMVVIEGHSTVDTVKRVAAVGGDTLAVDDAGHVTRNGLLVFETNAKYGRQDNTDWLPFPYTVPQGDYFCMGDNRAISLDSRNAAVGSIPAAQIAGRVVLSLRLQSGLRQ